MVAIRSHRPVKWSTTGNLVCDVDGSFEAQFDQGGIGLTTTIIHGYGTRLSLQNAGHLQGAFLFDDGAILEISETNGAVHNIDGAGFQGAAAGVYGGHLQITQPVTFSGSNHFDNMNVEVSGAGLTAGSFTTPTATYFNRIAYLSTGDLVVGASGLASTGEVVLAAGWNGNVVFPGNTPVLNGGVGVLSLNGPVSGTNVLLATGSYASQTAPINTAGILSLEGPGSFVLADPANDAAGLVVGEGFNGTGAVNYRDANDLDLLGIRTNGAGLTIVAAGAIGDGGIGYQISTNGDSNTAHFNGGNISITGASVNLPVSIFTEGGYKHGGGRQYFWGQCGIGFH